MALGCFTFLSLKLAYPHCEPVVGINRVEGDWAVTEYVEVRAKAGGSGKVNRWVRRERVSPRK